MTPENLTAPWLLFEAGAVATHADSRVWTYLYGLHYTEVKDPLSQFQHTKADEVDTKKLVIAINQQLKEGAHSEETIQKVFRLCWPDLLEKLKATPESVAPEKIPVGRLERVFEMTSEILVRFREQSSGPTVDPNCIRDDNDRIQMSEVIGDILVQHVRAAGIKFHAVGTCEDGAYSIDMRNGKNWRIEKRSAEDLALGRISFTQVLSSAVQHKNPCLPDHSSSADKSDGDGSKDAGTRELSPKRKA